MGLPRDINDIYGPKASVHRLSDVVKRFGDILELSSRCKTCGGKPTIRRNWGDPRNDSVKIVARCHGDARTLEVDNVTIEQFDDQPGLVALRDFCRNPFPVNFARHGKVSEGARRERRQRTST